MAKPKKGGPATTIGAILVGFDQQIFRSIPPAQELVHHARPDDPAPTDVVITLFSCARHPTAPDAHPETPADPAADPAFSSSDGTSATS